MFPATTLRSLTLATLVAAVALGGLVTGGAAGSTTTTNRLITQRSIGGAELGLRQRAYVAAFGRSFRIDRLERRLTSLVYTKLGVTVFLKSGKGVAINTSGRTFRTAAGIGPCSAARGLTAAYGKRLRQLPTTGPVSLYRLGNLVFRVARPLHRVGAVTLGKGDLAVLIAGNSSDCGTH